MDLLIYGAGGLGREVYDAAERNNDGRWNEILFIDDGREESEIYRSRSIKWETALREYSEGGKKSAEALIAVGEPATRELLYGKVLNSSIAPATLIDKTAIISPSARIGKGTMVLEMSVVHADVTVGENVLIQPMAALGHDDIVSDNSVISSFSVLAGHCTVGKTVYIGMQSAVREGSSVGDKAIVGMGAIVCRDVEAGMTVIGNPARATKGNEDHKVFHST